MPEQKEKVVRVFNPAPKDYLEKTSKEIEEAIQLLVKAQQIIAHEPENFLGITLSLGFGKHVEEKNQMEYQGLNMNKALGYVSDKFFDVLLEAERQEFVNCVLRNAKSLMENPFSFVNKRPPLEGLN